MELEGKHDRQHQGSVWPLTYFAFIVFAILSYTWMYLGSLGGAPCANAFMASVPISTHPQLATMAQKIRMPDYEMHAV
jgi:hypothetical protein